MKFLFCTYTNTSMNRLFSNVLASKLNIHNPKSRGALCEVWSSASLVLFEFYFHTPSLQKLRVVARITPWHENNLLSLYFPWIRAFMLNVRNTGRFAAITDHVSSLLTHEAWYKQVFSSFWSVLWSHYNWSFSSCTFFKKTIEMRQWFVWKKTHNLFVVRLLLFEFCPPWLLCIILW